MAAHSIQRNPVSWVSLFKCVESIFLRSWLALSLACCRVPVLHSWMYMCSRIPSAEGFGAVRHCDEPTRQCLHTRTLLSKSPPSDLLSSSPSSHSLPGLSLQGDPPLYKIISELPHVHCPLSYSFCVASGLSLSVSLPSLGWGGGAGGRQVSLSVPFLSFPFLSSFPSLPCSWFFFPGWCKDDQLMKSPWLESPAVLSSICVTSGKALDFSVPRFHHKIVVRIEGSQACQVFRGCQAWSEHHCGVSYYFLTTGHSWPLQLWLLPYTSWLKPSKDSSDQPVPGSVITIPHLSDFEYDFPCAGSLLSEFPGSTPQPYPGFLVSLWPHVFGFFQSTSSCQFRYYPRVQSWLLYFPHDHPFLQWIQTSWTNTSVWFFPWQPSFPEDCWFSFCLDVLLVS